MKWTNGHVLLLREILAVEPYTFKPKSKERGNAWTLIANTLNTLKDPMFNVNQRSVRDRYKVLETRFNEKEREEAKASGISPEESEIDQAMQEIIEKMNEAEQSYHKISEEKKIKKKKIKNQLMRCEGDLSKHLQKQENGKSSMTVMKINRKRQKEADQLVPRLWPT